MSVEQPGVADTVRADDRFDAGERDFELDRLGRDGKEKAVLRGLRFYRIHTQPDMDDRGIGRMRGKIDRLEQAFDGHFADHHRFLLARMLSRIEGLDADIAAVDAQIEVQLAPFAEAAARLDEIPGVGPVAAAAIIAEIGVDMSRFATAGHLCSWAKFAPGINSSAGKSKGSASSGHGNPYLARVLGEAVGMSPLLVLFSVTAVGILFGGFAVILAVPLVAVLVTVVDVVIREKDPAEEDVPTVLFPAKEAEN